MQVVQCLHSCFLYDTVSFLDEVRFHRLLPMLVSQLAAQPPASVSEQLVLQPANNAASADSKTGSDPFGEAVVAALVQMAVTANNDALWKSLNHQVCAQQKTCFDSGAVTLSTSNFMYRTGSSCVTVPLNFFGKH